MSILQTNLSLFGIGSIFMTAWNAIFLFVRFLLAWRREQGNKTKSGRLENHEQRADHRVPLLDQDMRLLASMLDSQRSQAVMQVEEQFNDAHS